MTRKIGKALTIGAVLGALAYGLLGAFTANAAEIRHRVEFYKVTQDVGTNGIQRFIIKGDGCLSTEDATKLRLVEYAPSKNKVIYRCVVGK